MNVNDHQWVGGADGDTQRVGNADSATREEDAGIDDWTGGWLKNENAR